MMNAPRVEEEIRSINKKSMKLNQTKYLGSFWRTQVWHIRLLQGMELVGLRNCRICDIRIELYFFKILSLIELKRLITTERLKSFG